MGKIRYRYGVRGVPKVEEGVKNGFFEERNHVEIDGVVLRSVTFDRTNGRSRGTITSVQEGWKYVD